MGGWAGLAVESPWSCSSGWAISHLFYIKGLETPLSPCRGSIQVLKMVWGLDRHAGKELVLLS